jgi:hypothetical protein
LAEKPPNQIQGEHMKRTLLLLAALAVSTVAAGTLMAQAMKQANPFLGSWKMNPAKSKFTGVAGPKSLGREVVAQGEGAKITYSGVNAEGKAIDYSFTSNYDGKDAAITGSGAPGGADAVAIKRTGANTTEAVLKKDGKEIGKSSSSVSKDGKVTTTKGTGKGPDGKDFSTVVVYDKQ